jgi:hypothetical protein
MKSASASLLFAVGWFSPACRQDYPSAAGRASMTNYTALFEHDLVGKPVPTFPDHAHAFT